MVVSASTIEAKSLATIDASEIYSALGETAALHSEYNSADGTSNPRSSGMGETVEGNDGISVINKTVSGSNSTSLVLPIGENFITKW